MLCSCTHVFRGSKRRASPRYSTIVQREQAAVGRSRRPRYEELSSTRIRGWRDIGVEYRPRCVLNQLPICSNLALCGNKRVVGEQKRRFSARRIRNLDVGFVVLEPVPVLIMHRIEGTIIKSYIGANESVSSGKARRRGLQTCRKIQIMCGADPSGGTDGWSGVAQAAALIDR